MKNLTTMASLALGSAMLLGSADRAAAQLWTPAEISTAAWYDADDASTITHTTNAVTQWNDKSGNALHATAPLANGPIYTASDTALNSMGSIGYDPTNTVVSYLDTPTITSTGQVYMGGALAARHVFRRGGSIPPECGESRRQEDPREEWSCDLGQFELV